MEALETIELDGYTIEIHWDEFPESPRSWDNLSILAQLSRDYMQPDTERCTVRYCTRNHGADEVDLLIEAWDRFDRDTEKVERYARAFLDAAAVDWWNDPRSGSRIVGIITRETAEREGVTDPLAALNAELRTYAAWADGEVYGYVVTGPDGDDIDSCWGFYGYEDRDGYMLDQAKEAVEADRERIHAERVTMFRGLVG